MKIPGAEGAQRRGVWSWVAAGLIAAIALYFSLRGVDWRRVGQLIVGARWQFLLLCAATMCVSSFSRSLRWRILLNATENLGVLTVFWATMAGYLGNNVLPARAGELIRSFLISARSSLSRTYVLTTALSERLMDVIALVLWSSIVLLRVDPKPRWMADLSRTMAIVSGIGAVAIMIVPHTGRLLETMLQKIPMPEKVRALALGLTEQVLSGLRAFHDWGRFAGFVALTAWIWVVDAAGAIALAKSVGFDLSFSVALLLLTGLGLGSALPSTPGYVGIYQFVAVSILVPFGVSRDAALAYILLFQALNYVVVIGFGLPGLYRLSATAPAPAA